MKHRRRDPNAECEKEYPVSTLPKELKQNNFVRAAVARKYYSEGDFTSSYLISKKILAQDPFALDVLPAHAAALVELGNKQLVIVVYRAGLLHFASTDPFLSGFSNRVVRRGLLQLLNQEERSRPQILPEMH